MARQGAPGCREIKETASRIKGRQPHTPNASERDVHVKLDNYRVVYLTRPIRFKYIYLHPEATNLIKIISVHSANYSPTSRLYLGTF